MTCCRHPKNPTTIEAMKHQTPMSRPPRGQSVQIVSIGRTMLVYHGRCGMINRHGIVTYPKWNSVQAFHARSFFHSTPRLSIRDDCSFWVRWASWNKSRDVERQQQPWRRRQNRQDYCTILWRLHRWYRWESSDNLCDIVGVFKVWAVTLFLKPNEF